MRQVADSIIQGEAFLYRPAIAVRVRWDQNTDTPLPPEEPAGSNPPDGAIIDYWLRSTVSGPVTLEVADSAGQSLRRYSSADLPEAPVEGRNIGDYWIRPPQVVSIHAGMHRFVWDLHYPPPAVLHFSYPITAIYRNTPPTPQGPWAQPGRYTVKLTVNGKTYNQPLTVRMDPRVKIPTAGLAQQFTLSWELYRALDRDLRALRQVQAVRSQLSVLREKAPGTVAGAIVAMERKVSAFEGSDDGYVWDVHYATPPSLDQPDAFANLNAQLASLYGNLQGVDATPTTQVVAATGERRRALARLLQAWEAFKAGDLTRLNRQLGQTNLPAVETTKAVETR